MVEAFFPVFFFFFFALVCATLCCLRRGGVVAGGRLGPATPLFCPYIPLGPSGGRHPNHGSPAPRVVAVGRYFGGHHDPCASHLTRELQNSKRARSRAGWPAVQGAPGVVPSPPPRRGSSASPFLSKPNWLKGLSVSPPHPSGSVPRQRAGASEAQRRQPESEGPCAGSVGAPLRSVHIRPLPAALPTARCH